MKLVTACFAVVLAMLSQVSQAGETVIGLALTKTEIENTRLDNGNKIFLNAMANENFGFEAAMGNYGDTWYTEFSSTNFAFLAATSGTVSVYGKLGLALWRAEIDDYYGSETIDGEDLLVGLGMNIKAGSAVRIKFELEGIDADGADVVAASLGLGVAF
jgi:hypothetical protein